MNAREFIFKSPTARTAIPLGLALGVGLFSNFLVTEMTVDGSIKWALFYQTISFYALSAFLLASYAYQRFLYGWEAEVLRFADATFCEAYARSQLIPAHIEAAKADIAGGNVGRFNEAMTQLKRVIK